MKIHLRHRIHRARRVSIERRVVAVNGGRHIGRGKDARADRGIAIRPKHGGDRRRHAPIRRERDFVIRLLVAVINVAKARHVDRFQRELKFLINGGAAFGVKADGVEGQPAGDSF